MNERKQANNATIQAQTADGCESSLTKARRLVTEHMLMVDIDIAKFSEAENYEMCAELKHVRRGLQYAFEDITSLETSFMMDGEIVTLPSNVHDAFQKLGKTVDVNGDLVKITTAALLLCDATFAAAHDAIDVSASMPTSAPIAHAQIENLRTKFMLLRREMDSAIKKVVQ